MRALISRLWSAAWRWALSWALVSAALPARADHLMGFDWQMQALSGATYRLRLSLYVDAVNGGPEAVGDPSVGVAVYARRPAGGASRLIQQFLLPRTAASALPGAGPGCSFADLPTRMLEYEAQVTFNADPYDDPDGYYLVWERCCRNSRSVNLSQPTQEGMVAYMEFPSLRGTGNQYRANSRPQFTQLPRAAGFCIGVPLSVSFAATDADADSVAYSLVSPLAGFTTPGQPTVGIPRPAPYPTVTYTGGFSLQQPLPGGFRLDRRTGLLTGTPTALGTFVVAVRCEEFRQGQKLGENRREQEITIINCVPNTPPQLTALDFNPADTLRITGGTDNCRHLRVFDAQPGQTVRVQVVGGAPVRLSPAQYTVPFPAAPLDLTLCWTDCSRPYRQLLLLVATDDGCLFSRPDTFRVAVVVTPSPNAPPTLRLVPPADTLTVAAGEPVAFGVEARDADGDVLHLRLRLDGQRTLPAALTLTPAAGAAPLTATVQWPTSCRDVRPAPYVFWLTALDDGCRLADSVRVVVRVVAPGGAGEALGNVITPEDHDSRNDCFGLGEDGGCGGAFGRIRIYNRWGRLVYETTDAAFCWDAAGLAAGTYYYLLERATGPTRGLVTVVR